jgi:hypothetical protein
MRTVTRPRSSARRPAMAVPGVSETPFLADECDVEEEFGLDG